VSRSDGAEVASGVFRRLAPSEGSAFAGVFGVVEAVFAPAAHDAREELQRQKRVGERNPADTDPPDAGAPGRAPKIVAPGRAGTPFSGSIQLSRAHQRDTPSAPPR
jgi:hypothetical protein